MASEIPEITYDMRREALAKAMEMRKLRSEFHAKVRSGELLPADALDCRDEPFLANLRVKLFIQDIPGFGAVKTERLMKAAGIAENRRLKGLGKRQIEALKDELSQRRA